MINQKLERWKKFKQNVFLWTPVILYCFTIYFISEKPIQGKVFSIKGIDKVFHTGEYFILSFLFARALFWTFFFYEINGSIIFWAILLTTCYGVSDEIHQFFVPFRDGDLWDVAFDSLGAFLGQKTFMLGRNYYGS